MKKTICIIFCLIGLICFSNNLKPNYINLQKLDNVVLIDHQIIQLDKVNDVCVNIENSIDQTDKTKKCIIQALTDSHNMINQEVDLETAAEVAYFFLVACVLS
jgi:hypothetical protein